MHTSLGKGYKHAYINGGDSLAWGGEEVWLNGAKGRDGMKVHFTKIE